MRAYCQSGGAGRKWRNVVAHAGGSGDLYFHWLGVLVKKREKQDQVSAFADGRGSRGSRTNQLLALYDRGRGLPRRAGN